MLSTVDRTTPLAMHTQLLKAEKSSRVVRYVFPCMLLARWTEGALRKLQRHEGVASARTRPAFAHSCPAEEAVQGAGRDAGSPRKRGDAKSCSWSARGGGLQQH